MPIHQRDTTIRIKTIEDPDTREYYSDVVTRRHYLESSAISSRTIVHVAVRGREEVAILTWEPGTRHWFGLRDQVIGWTKEQREKRLKYCVENRRFLMLVEEQNLASQVLSSSLLQLQVDGQAKYGHEFLLAETFVDPSLGYDGGCYKGAGWTDAGLTQGGGEVLRREVASGT